MSFVRCLMKFMKEESVNRMRQELSVKMATAALLVSFFPMFNQAQTAAPAPTVASVQPAGLLLVAKIVTRLNTKNAKVGDVLAAKTVKAGKLPDGTDIPKGSKLVASVTSIQSKKTGGGNSILTFRFDQIEVKGGATVPIRGMVVAIGPGLGPKDSLGANSVIGRGGVGSDPGLDPQTGLGRPGARDEDNIPMGSTLEGVALGRHMDADWTTALQGVKTDIDLDSDVVIKVQLK
jgi:hypothetical protein